MTDQTSQLIIETIQLIATNHLNFFRAFLSIWIFSRQAFKKLKQK
jgi:hypothetical protein